MSVDTTNRHVVGIVGRTVVVLNPPEALTPTEALVFAAWLVTMAEIADPEARDFDEVLEAVQDA